MLLYGESSMWICLPQGSVALASNRELRQRASRFDLKASKRAIRSTFTHSFSSLDHFASGRKIDPRYTIYLVQPLLPEIASMASGYDRALSGKCSAGAYLDLTDDSKYSGTWCSTKFLLPSTYPEQSRWTCLSGRICPGSSQAR